MDEQKEVWPPAPLERVAPAPLPAAPRLPFWIQCVAGLVAGILFVPVLWICALRLLRIEFPVLAPSVLVMALGAALGLSALAWRRCWLFALVFGIASVIMAALAWLYSTMPDPFS